MSFSVLHDAVRGRYVVTSRAFKRGEEVFREECFCSVVSTFYQDVICAYCCRLCSDKPVVAIAADDPTRYCSTGCAQSDYTVHAYEGKGQQLLQRLRVHGVDVHAIADSLRLILRLGAIRKHSSSSSNGSISASSSRLHPLLGKANSFSDVMLLEANDKQTSPEATGDILSIAQQLEKVAKILQLPLSKDDIVFLLHAIQCNAHKITSEVITNGSVGLFPFTSMLNHSCRPSCQHSFVSGNGQPPVLVIRALRDMEQGEELCYSYVPLYDSRRARQEQLLSAYGFCCTCERCCGGADDAIDGGPGGGEARDAAVAAIEGAICDCYSDPSHDSVRRLLACSAKSSAASSALSSPLHRAMFRSYHCSAVTAQRSMLNGEQGTAQSVSDADTVIACGLLFLGAYGFFIDTPAPEVSDVLLCMALALAHASGMEDGDVRGAPTDASVGALLDSFLGSAWGVRLFQGFAVDTAPLLQSARRCVARFGSGSSSYDGDTGVVRALCSALYEGSIVMKRVCGKEELDSATDLSKLVMKFVVEEY